MNDARGSAIDGPGLVIGDDSVVANGLDEPANDGDDSALSLALASCAPAARRRLMEEIDYATARLEAQLSPLGTDFSADEGSAVEGLYRALAHYGPVLTAARAMESGEWHLPNAHVRAVRTCTGTTLAKCERCAPLWGETSDASLSRARCATWPAANTVVLAFASPAARDGCAGTLRDRVSENASTMGLVLNREDLELHAVPERAPLESAAQRWGRAMAANEIRDTQHLDAFAKRQPVGRVAPWLELGEAERAVVPRLSALVRKGALAREIEGVAACAHARWVHGRGR